ncbi:HD-GYP domain-containing protein [Melaminivora sp.]|uniref:HD-GYP domain-containing protein n=1 Tax=Melaminivora sp. TaxID=1933032 RepID=UPI0028ABD988|nr:HD-GYP domain-containing protein [Melaminivora sp.]
MLKRIRVEDLTLGMYVHEFCGSWLDHPFWRSRFAIAQPEDLARIRATPVREVWIDTGRGRDVARPRPAAPPAAAPAPATAPLPAAAHATRSASAEQEMRRAARIVRRSKDAVVHMFQQARMGRAIHPASARGLVQEIQESVQRNPGALISLARLKSADDYTYLHSVAVCALMVALTRQLGMDEQQTHTAGMAGLLHDLGKARTPLEVLNKPGSLSDEEFALIKQHPVVGWQLLQAGGVQDADVLDACRHHHERLDGTGYPDGLRGEQISTLARMTALCDVYDAITSDRPYKRGWDPAQSIRRMASWTGSHLDARLFQAFVKCLGIYPTGSLVRLASGRLGVVVEQNPGTLVAPRVRVFFSLRSSLRIPPELIDLAAPGCRDQITGREDPQDWGFSDLSDLWAGMALEEAA